MLLCLLCQGSGLEPVLAVEKGHGGGLVTAMVTVSYGRIYVHPVLVKKACAVSLRVQILSWRNYLLYLQFPLVEHLE